MRACVCVCVCVCGVVCLGMCVHARAKNLSARLRSFPPPPPPPLLRTDLRHWCHLAGKRILYAIMHTTFHSVPCFLEIIDRKCCILFGPPCISVARGGGGGEGRGPNNAFSEFCRYIWKFVGTFGDLSVHVSRQACHLYRQSIWSTNKNIERNSSLRM